MEDPDANELRRFGYAPQLRRSMGGFSSFAVAFSLISVFTGVSANFGHGLRQVGGLALSRIEDFFRAKELPLRLRPFKPKLFP